MKTLAGRAVGAVLVCLAVAGCGGGSSNELSHNEFITRANKLCVDAQKKVYDLHSSVLEGDVFPSGFPDERFERYYGESVAIGRAMVKDVRALNAPASDEDTVRDGLSALESELDNVGELGDALESPSRYTELAGRRFDPALGKRLEAMASLGLEPCASVGFGPAAGR